MNTVSKYIYILIFICIVYIVYIYINIRPYFWKFSCWIDILSCVSSCWRNVSSKNPCKISFLYIYIYTYSYISIISIYTVLYCKYPNNTFPTKTVPRFINGVREGSKRMKSPQARFKTFLRYKQYTWTRTVLRSGHMIVQVVVVSAWLEWLYNHSKKQLESTRNKVSR